MPVIVRAYRFPNQLSRMRSTGQFTTVPGGLLITADGKTVHHAGDTALTLDMQLLKGKVDVAILPIGDNFTMGPDDALRAVTFLNPKHVVPVHYNTWPPIKQDGEAWAERVRSETSAQVTVMQPGDTIEI